VFLLKLISDDWTGEQSFEVIKQFEPSIDGIIIIESLSNYRSQSALKFLDFGAELVEIIIELLFSYVHDIVGHTGECGNSLFKFLEDLSNRFCQSLSLCSTEFNALKFIELHDGVGEIKNVRASLKETI